MLTVIKKLKGHLVKQGWTGGLLLFLFPMVLVITNSVRLVKTLWSSRVLANGKWSEFNRFKPSNGINSLFYWTQAINFDRFGRRGASPYMATGNCQLGNFWFSSLTSSYLYWRLGAMLPLLSMLGWVGSHSIWFTHTGVDALWLLVVLLATLISSYFYAGAFVFLNYNAFGWLFVPLGLYGLLVDNYWIAGFAWLAASVGSLTVIFIVGWLSLVWALVNLSFLPLVALLPAVFKLATHFLFVKDLKGSLIRIASGIGLLNAKNSQVRYKRSKSKDLISIPSIYFLATWGGFSGIVYLQGQLEYALLFAALILLWILNASIARFADSQSLYMAMISVATPVVILTMEPLLLLMYWLGVSPLPILIGACSGQDLFVKPRAYKPFRVAGLINQTVKFLSPVPKDGRILIALEDPARSYDKVFDGYRTIYELLFYSGNLERKLVFPDWNAIFDNNTVDSPGFWGRTPQEVLYNSRQWNADYVLVYQESNSKLENNWSDEGFTNLSEMDWGPIYSDALEGESCWGNKPVPKWFLLKAPKQGAVS